MCGENAHKQWDHYSKINVHKLVKKQILMSLEAAQTYLRQQSGGPCTVEGSIAHDRVNRFGTKVDADRSGTKKNLGYGDQHRQPSGDTETIEPRHRNDVLDNNLQWSGSWGKSEWAIGKGPSAPGKNRV